MADKETPASAVEATASTDDTPTETTVDMPSVSDTPTKHTEGDTAVDTHTASATDGPAESPATESPATESQANNSTESPADQPTESPAESPAENDPAYFTNADGQTLYRRYWKPDLKDGEKPRALVHIGHGMCEHSGWYETLGDALAKQGILAFAHDHVGHGRSEGDRLEIADFNVYPRDTTQFMEQMKTEYPDCQLFAFGYSLGATVSVMIAARRPDMISGLVLEAAGSAPITIPQKLGIKALNVVKPGHGVYKLKAESVFTDPDVRKRYVDDEFTYKEMISARYFSKSLQVDSEITSLKSKVSCPILVLHGEKDSLHHKREPLELMGRVASADATFKIYPGAAHNVLMETTGQGEELVKDTLDWIVKRLK